MKKLSVVVMVLACVLLSHSHVVAQGKIKIAVIPKGTTHVFWKSVEAGARKASEELGVEIVWKGPVRENDRVQLITKANLSDPKAEALLGIE